MNEDLDTTDPRYVEFTERLARRLALVANGRQLNESTLRDVEKTLAETRLQYVQLRGLKLPPLVVFAMPSIGKLEVVRGDYDGSQIDEVVVYCARKYGAPSYDLVFGLRRAFPDYARKQFEASIFKAADDAISMAIH